MTSRVSRHRPAATSRSGSSTDMEIQQDMTVGLHTVSEINQSIRYADTKAGALAAVQALSVTVLAAKRDAVPGHLVVTVLFLVCVAAVLVSAGLLAAGQSPRLFSGRPPAASRIAFPSLVSMPAADVVRAPSLVQQHEQIWRQATELAAIAMAKYRWLHRALFSTLGTLAAVLLWLVVTTWLTRH